MNESILDLIGNTPLVKSGLVKNPNVHLYYKLEGDNPGGSVKDRAAFHMIKGALDRGDITQETRLVEATSGNTGIALAMVAGIFKLNIELIMPENSTEERVQTMRAFGARVTLTSAEDGMEGARDYADEFAEKSGAFIINQFSNPDNWKAHYKTTGPEIWNDTNGRITHFISSMGTTGTIMGTSTYLKQRNPDIQVIGVQPSDGSNIPGIRKWPQAYLPKIFSPAKVDRILEVSETDAMEMTHRLAKEEGVFAGLSSGGAAISALRLCDELEQGLVVSIVCDRGDRYLSSGLFT